MAEPHTSFANPPEYNAIYSEYSQGEVEPIVNGLKDPPKADLVARGPGEYYANITYMDAQIGRVLHWLRDNRLYDDTVIVFSSDNGAVTSAWINWWEVNAYGSTGGFRGRKHMLYEGGIRVPAIIRYPAKVAAGTVSDAPVIGMDWFVTLAAMGGGDIPDDRAIDGIDIQPVFAGKALPERTLFWSLDSVTELEFAVRRGDWKLLLDRNHEPQELYNLAEDPHEFFNLLESEPDVAARLGKAALKTIAAIENDPLRPK